MKTFTFPPQFFATKMTMIGLIVVHLVGTIWLGTLTLLYFSEAAQNEEEAPNEEQSDKFRPRAIIVGSFGLTTDLSGLIALLTWEFVASLIFAVLCLVSVLLAEYLPIEIPVLTGSHYILSVLAGLLCLLSSYYMFMQCQVGLLRPRPSNVSAKSGLPAVEEPPPARIVESKGMNYVKMIVSGVIVLHLVWSVFYLFQYHSHLRQIASGSGYLPSHAIALKRLTNNWVIYQYFIAESSIATVATLLSDIVGLFGVLQNRMVLVLTFFALLFFDVVYAFTGAEASDWIGIATGLLLLALTLFYLAQLIGLWSAADIEFHPGVSTVESVTSNSAADSSLTTESSSE